MVLEDDRTGAGIPHISGTFNAKLVARLNRAPGDIMGFLEACAMGNQARVEELLEKGGVSACSECYKSIKRWKSLGFQQNVNILSRSTGKLGMQRNKTIIDGGSTAPQNCCYQS